MGIDRAPSLRRYAPDERARFCAIAGLHACYGESHILHGVDFTSSDGEVVTLLGRNGAGRTTTMKARSGTGRQRARARCASTAARPIGLPPHRIAALGVGYCPEERGIFASLSDRGEPAAAARRGRRRACRSKRSTTCFPIWRSGAPAAAPACPAASSRCWRVARILRTGARLLLLDEISEGLAPVIVQALGADHPDAAREQGYTIVMVGAELPFRRPAGRPFLRHGARPHRAAVRQPASLQRQNGHAARVPGRLTSQDQPKEHKHETADRDLCDRPWRSRPRSGGRAHARPMRS